MKFNEINARSSAFAEFLRSNEKAENTIKSYLHDLKMFSEWAAAQQYDDVEISRDLIVQYKNDLLTAGKHEKTINRKLTSIHRFLSFCGYTGEDADRLDIQGMNTLDDVITKSEYLRMLDAALTPPPQAVKRGLKPNPRLRMVMLILANTGIRYGELKYFTYEAIKDSTPESGLKVTNKGKTRIIPMNKKLKKAIMAYCTTEGITGGYIIRTRTGGIVSDSQLFKEMQKLAGYLRINKKHVHPHAFRHLFGQSYMDTYGRIDELADILGHSNIQTTRIYSRTSTKVKSNNVERMGLI